MYQRKDFVIPRRKEVFEYVSINPNATPNQVCKALGYSLTSTRELLHWFRDQGIMGHKEEKGPRAHNAYIVIGEYSHTDFVPEPTCITPVRLMSHLWTPQYANQIFNVG